MLIALLHCQKWPSACGCLMIFGLNHASSLDRDGIAQSYLNIRLQNRNIRNGHKTLEQGMPFCATTSNPTPDMESTRSFLAVTSTVYSSRKRCTCFHKTCWVQQTIHGQFMQEISAWHDPIYQQRVPHLRAFATTVHRKNLMSSIALFVTPICPNHYKTSVTAQRYLNC